MERRTSQTITEMSAPASLPVRSRMSTPKQPQPSTSAISEPDVSSMTGSTDSDAESMVAGPSLPKKKKSEVHVAAKQSKVKKLCRVDIELSSTDLEDFYDPDYDPDDPTFEPEDFLDISIVQSDDAYQNTEELGVEDDVFDICGDDLEELSHSSSATDIPGINKIKEVLKADIKEEKYIVCRGTLETLVTMCPLKLCKTCGKSVTHQLKKVGCTVECSWTCTDGHLQYKWSSSPVMPNGVYLTNFQAMSSVTLSGNQFNKIALFAQFLGLAFPSRTSFNRIQTKCVVPVVDDYWNNIQQSVLEEHRAVKVTVSGDGRMDSPGHTAKYCTYTVMNQADKSILAMEVVDKRETALKSVVMEARGFCKAMTTIRDAGVDLHEVVTDAHPQIGKIMRTSFPGVQHSYDMWHGAKNLGKKISKVALVKGNEALKPWIKDITNHFFHSAETCGGNVLQMQTRWISILNHMTNNHSWALGQCDHGELDEDREKLWINTNSKLMKDLEKQVSEPRLLRSFPYYVSCQTTAELESFNNHVLMYAPKRNAFSYPVYKCRCQLAAIDYSKHLLRTQLQDKDGNLRWRRAYSKAANNWTVKPVKESKKYHYIPDLQRQIAAKYCAGEQSLRSVVHLGQQDPRQISTHIAPVSPQPTAVIAGGLVSRLKMKKY